MNSTRKGGNTTKELVDRSLGFGLVHRNTGDFRQERFALKIKRDSRTLLALIENHMEHGTTIYRDCWRDYNGLTELDFPHYTVNHSMNFVDPETGRHKHR